MADVVSPLLQWMNANPEWAIFITFLISAAESIAIIGTVIPGSITMMAIGALAGADVIPLAATLFWAILGAILGDGVSYWLGHAFKGKLRNIWPFRSNPGILEKGEHFVHKYGVMSVFMGRFVGPVRALVPLIAGMLGMKPLHFTIANVASAILWAPIYMLPGIILGTAALELPPELAMHVVLAIFLILLFIILCLWTTYKIFQLIGQQTEQILVKIWDKLERSRYFHVTTVLLKSPNPEEHHGQLTLAFYFLLTTTFLIALISYVKYVTPSHIFLNEAFFHLFRGIRTSHLDSLIFPITLLGQKQILWPVSLSLCIWFWLKKHYRLAVHAFALIIFTSGSIFLIKHLAQIPRPWGVLSRLETFSMPSGHTTLAVVTYLGLALIIAVSIRPSFRRFVYLPFIVLIFLVSFSRIYLGVHWFTDIVTGWLLGGALLMLISLSFRRKYEIPFSPYGTLIVFFITLPLFYSIYYIPNAHQWKNQFTQLSWPQFEITLPHWWSGETPLQESRVSLFGFPSKPINIEWEGDLQAIKRSLQSRGFESPPPRNWISILQRISDVKSAEHLPIIPPLYLDKKPVVIMVYPINGKKKLILHLWESNFIFKETKKPLWVGTVGIIPRSYSWLFKRLTPEKTVNSHFISFLSLEKARWQWKKIKVNPHKNVEYDIALIREQHASLRNQSQ